MPSPVRVSAGKRGRKCSRPGSCFRRSVARSRPSPGFPPRAPSGIGAPSSRRRAVGSGSALPPAVLVLVAGPELRRFHIQASRSALLGGALPSAFLIDGHDQLQRSGVAFDVRKRLDGELFALRRKCDHRAEQAIRRV
jgi:hypothetical protein